METVVVNVQNFAGGLNKKEFPEFLADNEWQDVQNLLLSDIGIPEPRRGYTLITDTGGALPSIPKATGIYQKNDGTEIKLARATVTGTTNICPTRDYIYRHDGTNAWIPIASLIPGGDRTCFINFNGSIYIMDGYNFMKWDGTTLTDLEVNVDTAPTHITTTLDLDPTNANGSVCSVAADLATTGYAGWYLVMTGGTAVGKRYKILSNVAHGDVTLDTAANDGGNAYTQGARSGDSCKIVKTYMIPRYGCVHEQRLFIGNLRIWETSAYVAYPNTVSFSGVLADDEWTPPADPNYNLIDLDYPVTNLVSYRYCVVFTERNTGILAEAMDLTDTYYFPSYTTIFKVGAFPFTAVLCENDILFVNEQGVRSVMTTQNFGDIEVARLSYKIDPIFTEDVPAQTAPGNLSAIYVDWRDEYWLSVPMATGYKILVAKTSLRDQKGRPAWTVLNIADQGRELCVSSKTAQIYFTPLASADLYVYGSYADNATPIQYYAQTKNFGSESYPRKRLNSIYIQKMRWGNFSVAEGLTVMIIEGNQTRWSYNTLFEIEATGPLWGTAIWRAFSWTKGYGAKQVDFDKIRIGIYAHRFSLKTMFSSALSGANMSQFQLESQLSRRG
jgi:hypothetical protein